MRRAARQPAAAGKPPEQSKWWWRVGLTAAPPDTNHGLISGIRLKLLLGHLISARPAEAYNLDRFCWAQFGLIRTEVRHIFHHITAKNIVSLSKQKKNLNLKISN